MGVYWPFSLSPCPSLTFVKAAFCSLLCIKKMATVVASMHERLFKVALIGVPLFFMSAT